jgi:hypothetical protein
MSDAAAQGGKPIQCIDPSRARLVVSGKSPGVRLSCDIEQAAHGGFLAAPTI